MKNKFLKPALAAAILGMNDAPLLMDAGANANPVGQICAANEARFTSTHYSEPLTAYTTGWRDPENLDVLLESLFPSVQVGRRFEFKAAANAEAFLSEADDIRAIGSLFKRVEYTGTSVNQKTLNKGLTMRVDHDDEVGDGWREAKVQQLIQRLLRNDLRRGIAIIDAAATNAAKTWGNAANPDADVRAALKTGTDTVGMRGNVVVFGEAAWDLRLDSFEVQNTPYAGRAASMTKEQLAQKYMVDRVEIVKARYQSSASAKTVIVPSVVYTYIALQGASKDDASNVKRFITPTSSGKFRVYIEEHAKFTDISVEHYSNIVATSTLGIRKLTCSA
jgi:hypothetical protein